MMRWNKKEKQLMMSFQDLEHVLGEYDPEHGFGFDDAIKSELRLSGLNRIDPEKDINTILIEYQSRTIWAKNTPTEYLKTHKGVIAEQTIEDLRGVIR